MKMESKKLSLHVRQIQNLGQLKYKTEIFSKRTHKISKILFNLCSYESLASLESKIRRCPFLIFIIIKNIVLIIITTHAKALKTNSFLNTSVWSVLFSPSRRRLYLCKIFLLLILQKTQTDQKFPVFKLEAESFWGSFLRIS